MRRVAALVLVVGGLALAAPVSAHTSCGYQVASARWHHVTAGWWLAITPTACGRRTAATARSAAFNEAIRRGGRGAPDRRSLYWQFVCHAEFAASKPTWDIEAWRPDVGLLATIVASCNPK